MPTYKNTTDKVIDMQGIRVEPGESISTNIFVKTLPTGITQTSADPCFDNVLYSTKINSSQTVNLPSSILNNYNVRIYCSAGEISFQLNSSSSNSLILGQGESFDVFCAERIVDNIIFTIATGTAYLTIIKS